MKIKILSSNFEDLCFDINGSTEDSNKEDFLNTVSQFKEFVLNNKGKWEEEEAIEIIACIESEQYLIVSEDETETFFNPLQDYQNKSESLYWIFEALKLKRLTKAIGRLISEAKKIEQNLISVDREVFFEKTTKELDSWKEELEKEVKAKKANYQAKITELKEKVSELEKKEQAQLNLIRHAESVLEEDIVEYLEKAKEKENQKEGE